MLEKYPDVIEIKDLCEILRIDRKTAYRLLKEREIHYRKIGRRYKIPKEFVIKYLHEI